MRIAEEERAEITRAISRQDPHAVVYLFASRTDDGARGDDVDLLAVSDKIGISRRLDILAELHEKPGEQKIEEVFGEEARRRLFGSRLDDRKRGRH